jgi:hypothetical protein
LDLARPPNHVDATTPAIEKNVSPAQKDEVSHAA